MAFFSSCFARFIHAFSLILLHRFLSEYVTVYSQMYGAWYETYWQPPYFEKPEDVWYDFVEVWEASGDADTVDVRAIGR